MFTKTKAWLALENGHCFEGWSFGAPGERTGEVVFHTGMTGYQEIFSDPSYKGQIVVMTTPHIGNTGINPYDYESDRLHLEGLVVKSYSSVPSNWRSTQTLASKLQESKVPALEGIDTRHLTRILREEGSLRGVLTTEPAPKDILIEKAKNIPSMVGKNLAKEVTPQTMFQFEENNQNAQFHVVAYDLGMKRSILKKLVDQGCRITIVPSGTSADEVLKLQPDGIFLSNGPGDPAAVTEMIPPLKHLIGKKPIFGICLGHQILAIALEAKTSKLKFGHHGAKHPVQREETHQVEITSQNHNFVVEADTLPKDVMVTHRNLNDGTLEGFKSESRKILSVQYHPEAAPGPHDALYLFKEFRKMMEGSS